MGYAAFAGRRLLTYLHIFQQEEYDDRRFVQWLWRTKAFDRRTSVALMVLGLTDLLLSTSLNDYILPTLTTFIIVAFAAAEADPRKHAKKKLVITARAKRILVLAFAILLLFASVVTISSSTWFLWVVLIHFIPFALVLANALLRPFESWKQKKYWLEAHDKLARLRPIVIGITGSYGKTSVKHILAHVLEVYAPTLVTPGSVNTPMGIARIIRENLSAHHRFFICEMGAYGPGSIDRLCRLAPPNYGVITAIGHAHFERFRSIETVAATKLELAQAVIKEGGILVVSEDVFTLHLPASLQSHAPSFIVVGDGAEAKARILALRETARGVETDLFWNGKAHTLKAPLFGAHHGMNLAIVFAAACSMGMAPEDVAATLATTPQIQHRFEVKHYPNDIVVIDDAYNSNPTGFKHGLQSLDKFRKSGGRRILITPGMIELGTAHDEEHRGVGRIAGKHVDILLPIMPERITTLTEAYRLSNNEGVIVPCANFEEARSWMNTNLRSGDVVLIENDLPDLYEARLRL